MHSRNPLWSSASFNASLVDLALVGEGEEVLDLGCGRGPTLPYILTKVAPSGIVVAADRDQALLDGILSLHQDAAHEKRLETAHVDASTRLPFEDRRFDRVICQNVIECIADKDGLVREIHRVLKPGGSALVGHHDFDGAMVASDDRDLTRRLIHGFADHTQKWQDTSDGQMGRLLPGLAAWRSFDQVETETILLVDLVLSKESYAGVHIDGVVGLSESYGVTKEVAMAWLRSLKERSADGAFYYAIPWTYVLGRTAPLQAAVSATNIP